jgi:flagellar biosynthetic protein FliR
MTPLQAEVATLMLETSRVGGMMLLAPLPWQRAPNRARAALALLLAFVAHGGSPPAPSAMDSLAYLVLALPSEVLLGASIGMVVRVATSISEVAGDAISPLFGLSAASAFDPQTHAAVSPLTSVLNLLLMSLALSLGAHRMVLGAVMMSFRAVPAGAVVDINLVVPMLVRLTAMSLEVGVRVALPVLAVLLLNQVALAFVSRAAPTMQIFSIGFAVSIIVGMITFVVALPDVGQALARELLRIGPRIEALLLLVAG